MNRLTRVSPFRPATTVPLGHKEYDDAKCQRNNPNRMTDRSLFNRMKMRVGTLVAFIADILGNLHAGLFVRDFSAFDRSTA